MTSGIGAFKNSVASEEPSVYKPTIMDRKSMPKFSVAEQQDDQTRPPLYVPTRRAAPELQQQNTAEFKSSLYKQVPDLRQPIRLPSTDGNNRY